MGYKHNKAWRLTHVEARNAQRKRNYTKGATGGRSYMAWTAEEDSAVAKRDFTDKQLSTLIGRSVQAIQVRRSRITP